MLVVDYIAFGLILDDIEFADGGAARGVVGGGGPQTACGMRLWSERVGLAARVGEDLPALAWDWLHASGIDLAGVLVTSWPTLRARQRLDADGRRHHTWLVPGDTVQAQLRRSVEDLPAAYRSARGFHLGLHPEEPDLDLLQELRALGALVSVETFRPAACPPAPSALRALLEAADIFSANRAAAESLVGRGEPPALVERLADAGARVIALRLGADGSLVFAPGQPLAHIRAVPVNVVDPVGAGNAYCGAFLTGWAETGDVVEAGRRGAVAASFVLEQVGWPALTPALLADARERLAQLSHPIHGLRG